MVKNGATLLGAGFLGSFVNSSVVAANLNVNNIYNVKDFGATGKRADKATIAIRTAAMHVLRQEEVQSMYLRGNITLVQYNSKTM
jgi:hypothetical protein